MQEFPDNGFPLAMPSEGGAPPSNTVECLDPFATGVTPTVDAASEPWYANIAEAQEREPFAGNTIADDGD